jgi:hypothetical protein
MIFICHDIISVMQDAAGITLEMFAFSGKNYYYSFFYHFSGTCNSVLHFLLSCYEKRQSCVPAPIFYMSVWDCDIPQIFSSLFGHMYPGAFVTETKWLIWHRGNPGPC